MDRSAGDAFREGNEAVRARVFYPEVTGELGAEAVEEGLPAEPRRGAAYLGALRGRPPAEDLDQRALVRAPPCSEPAPQGARSEANGKNDAGSRRMRVTRSPCTAFRRLSACAAAACAGLGTAAATGAIGDAFCRTAGPDAEEEGERDR
jgi:hypothetical protein